VTAPRRLPPPPPVPAEAREVADTVPPPSKRKCSCGWTLALDELCPDCDPIPRCACGSHIFYTGHAQCPTCRGDGIPESAWRAFERSLASMSDAAIEQLYRDCTWD
jgi:hypothetical protein